MYNLTRKNWIFIFCFMVLGQFGNAQQIQLLNLDSCLLQAKNNYPLIKQYDLIAKSLEYTVSNANKAYLPQISVTGIGGYIIQEI